MIKVYHFPATMFRSIPFEDSPKQVQLAVAEFPKYHLVAEVDSDDLDTALKSTRSLESHWSMNDGVKPRMISRSTCVGDVFQKGDEYFIVSSSGFVKVELTTSL